MLVKLNLFHLTGLMTGAIDVKRDWSVLSKSSFFKLLGLSFSSKLDYDTYIVSISKTASKKVAGLISSTEFLSPKVALYLYKPTIWPCKKYCYHVWAGAPNCYLDILDKLQKWVCMTVGPTLATSLESLAIHRNVASLSLLCWYYFGRCSSELPDLVLLPFCYGRSALYSDRWHDFSVTIMI